MPRKVSLKHIVRAIDEVLAQLESDDTKRDGPLDDKDKERSKKVLRGVRESVEGLCVPDFEIPG